MRGNTPLVGASLAGAQDDNAMTGKRAPARDAPTLFAPLLATKGSISGIIGAVT